MKNLLLILFVFSFFTSISQPVINRTLGTNTVNDPRWMATKNLVIPRYADTTTANLDKGIDSAGAIIFTYSDSGRVYVRKCFPVKYWAAIGSGGGGGSGGFLTANNGLTASTSTNVQWGGTLIKNTTIDGGNFGIAMDNVFDFTIHSDAGATTRLKLSTTTSNIFAPNGSNGYILKNDSLYEIGTGRSNDTLYKIRTINPITGAEAYSNWTGLGVKANNGNSVSGATVQIGGSDLIQYSAIGLNGFPLTLNHNGITSASQSDSNGLRLTNNTLATSSVQQWSPPIVLRGSGWQVFAGPSKPVDLRIENAPLATASLLQMSSSVNGAAYVIGAQISLGAQALGTSGTGTGYNKGGNMFIGGINLVKIWTAGASNISIGLDSTLASLSNGGGPSTSQFNTAIGASALSKLTIANENTAVGFRALSYTDADYNTAVGAYALFTNTTGIANSAFGKNALVFATTAQKNTAIGAGAMEATTTGGFNSALGEDALLHNTTGTNNIAIGWLSGALNPIGIGNISIGFNAGTLVASGDNNTFLGLASGNVAGQEDTVTHSIAIGANSFTTASNQMVLGSTNIHQTKIFGSQVGSGTDSLYSRKSDGTLGAIAQSSIVGATPTLQQVLTAGSTLNGSDNYANVNGGSMSIINGTVPYTAMGLTVDPSNNRTVITNNTGGQNFSLTGSTGLIRIQNNNGYGVIANPADSVIVGSVSGNFTKQRIKVTPDSIFIKNLSTSHGAADSMLVINPADYKIGYRPIPSGGASSLTVGTTVIASGTDTRILYDNAGVLGEYTITGTGTVVAMQTSPTFVTPILGTPTSGTLTNTTGYLWNNIANPTGDQALTFDVGEGSIWTNSNTTEDLLAINTSTLTTASLFSLNSTSTALAAGNNLAEFVLSGANGSSSITATAIRASVTNSGTTNTNIAIDATATGGATDNWAVNATGNIKITTANTTQVTTSAGLNVNANSLTNGTGVYIVSSTLQAGTLAQIVSTSTALAANNEGLDIAISGANGTNAITATGMRSTVTNTNGTSGTNIAAQFNASGATTANWALFTGSATGADGRININNATNIANQVAIFKSLTNTATDGIVVAANNETATLKIGYQTITASGGMQLASSATGVQVTSRLYSGAATAPTALIHIAAGTTAASSGPLKLTTGTLMTTAEVGGIEYNNALYSTNNAINRVAIGGTIADFTSDVSNSTTTETDIYTYTTKASTLAATGEKITFNYTLNLTDITATAAIQVYFGGTSIAATGALTVSATGAVIVSGYVIRTGASTARASVNISSPTASTAVYTSETDLTSLTFTNTNIVKITAQAGGASGGSGDIVGKLGFVSWFPASNN